MYAAAIAGYPLVAGLPVALGLGSREVSVPYRAAVLLLSLVVVIRSAHRRRLYSGFLWLPLAGFWTLYTARLIVDTLIQPVPLGRPPREYFLYALGTCFVPMVALLTRPSAQTLRAALRLSIIVSAMALLAAMYLVIRSLRGGNLGILQSGRFELATLNPISVGHLGVTLTILALFGLATLGLGAFGRALLVFAVGIGMLATGASASKGPLVALAACLGLLVFIDWRAGNRLRATAGLVAVPLLTIPLALYIEDRLGFAVISRLQGGLNDPERLGLLARARDQFLSSPFLGSSLDERVSLTYPHNTFVESFMAVGIVGGLCYATFHLAALGRAVRLVGSKMPEAWVGVICIQYTIGALFSGSLYTSNTMWTLLGAAVGVAAWTERSDRETISPLIEAPAGGMPS